MNAQQFSIKVYMSWILREGRQLGFLRRVRRAAPRKAVLRVFQENPVQPVFTGWRPSSRPPSERCKAGRQSSGLVGIVRSRHPQVEPCPVRYCRKLRDFFDRNATAWPHSGAAHLMQAGGIVRLASLKEAVALKEERLQPVQFRKTYSEQDYAVMVLTGFHRLNTALMSTCFGCSQMIGGQFPDVPGRERLFRCTNATNEADRSTLTSTAPRTLEDTKLPRRNADDLKELRHHTASRPWCLNAPEQSMNFPRNAPPLHENSFEGAIAPCPGSWNNDRRHRYRQKYGIHVRTGTAVNVQAMVSANTGEESGSGVAFPPQPRLRRKTEFYGES